MFGILNVKKKAEGFERTAFIDALKQWHLKRDQEQVALEQDFVESQLHDVRINIWDEIGEDGLTHCIIENEVLPNKVQLEIFLHVLNYVKTSPLFQTLSCSFDLVFWDDSVKYPELIDGENSAIGGKYWKLQVSNIEYDTLEVLVDMFNNIPDFNGKPISFYSES